MSEREQTIFTVEDHPEVFSEQEVADGATSITVSGDDEAVERWRVRKIGRIARDMAAAEAVARAEADAAANGDVTIQAPMVTRGG